MTRTITQITPPNRWSPSIKGINFDPIDNYDDVKSERPGTVFVQSGDDGSVVVPSARMWQMSPYPGPVPHVEAGVQEFVPQNSINVVSLGADPSGRTGSSTAINRAVEVAIKKGYGRVYIPAGNYLINEPIIHDSLIWMHGDGMSTYLRASRNIGGPIIKSFWETGTRWSYMQSLSDMRLDGNRVEQDVTAGCYGVQWSAPTGSGLPIHAIELIGEERVISSTPGQWFDSNRSLWNLWISYCGDTGLYMTGRGGVQAYNIVSYENGGHGFRPTYDSNFQNCVAARNGVAGFYLDDASIRLTGCKAWWSGYQGLSSQYGDPANELQGHGFHIRADYGVVMVGCEAQDNYASGFYFDTAKMCSATGSIADSNNRRSGDNAAVDFWESNNCTWEGDAFDRHNDSVRYQPNAVRFRSNSQQNTVRVRHRHFNGGASTSAVQYLTHIRTGSTLVNNNYLAINNYEGWQSSGSGAISPTVYGGRRCYVNLTSDTTIAHVAGQAHEYCEYEFCFLQNATGGWTVTFDPDFDVGSGFTASVGAGTSSTISFYWNGFKWVKKSEMTGV